MFGRDGSPDRCIIATALAGELKLRDGSRNGLAVRPQEAPHLDDPVEWIDFAKTTTGLSLRTALELGVIGFGDVPEYPLHFNRCQWRRMRWI